MRDANNSSVTVNVRVGSSNVLHTTAPANVTMGASGTQTFTISGGALPYTASSSNTSVARVGVDASTTQMTISGVSAGVATITVLDSTGLLPVSINVTVGAIAANTLFTTAPSAITIDKGAVSSYAISGSTGPYTTGSGNVAVATASSVGSTIYITGVGAGTTNVFLSDLTGNTVTTTVTVRATVSTPMVVALSALTANLGDVVTYVVTGGAPPYTIAAYNSSLVTFDPVPGIPLGTFNAGDIVQARLLNVGTTTVQIKDSDGQTATLSLTSTNSSASLGLSPNAFAVGEDYAAPIYIGIGGGTGPYTAYSGDINLAAVSVDVSVPTGARLKVDVGNQGNRCIPGTFGTSPVGTYVPYNVYPFTVTVVDSLGQSASSTISIRDNGMGTSAVPIVPALKQCGG